MNDMMSKYEIYHVAIFRECILTYLVLEEPLKNVLFNQFFLQRINLKVIKIFFNYYHSFFYSFQGLRLIKLLEPFFCSILCKTFLCHSYIYIIIYNRLDGKWHEWKKLQVIFEVYFGGKFWIDLCYSRNWLVLVKYLWMDSSKIAPIISKFDVEWNQIWTYLPIKMTRDIRKINEK